MLKACKKCRREGEKLFIKGDKCLSPKCVIIKRAYAPGDHGQSFKGKQSEYGKQLREKQKARRIYGIMEAQFRKYVGEAEKLEGNSSANLMKLLETRVDNLIYRTGFTSSRSDARQQASHGMFNVNGKKVRIPSYRLKAGDILSPIKNDRYKEVTLSSSLSWIEVDGKKMTATIKHLPSREEIDTNINENLIIEFYSR